VPRGEPWPGPTRSPSPRASALFASARMGTYPRGSVCKHLKLQGDSCCALCLGGVIVFASGYERRATCALARASRAPVVNGGGGE